MTPCFQAGARRGVLSTVAPGATYAANDPTITHQVSKRHYSFFYHLHPVRIVQGSFFDWSALKMTKCQLLKEFSELVLPKKRLRMKKVKVPELVPLYSKSS